MKKKLILLILIMINLISCRERVIKIDEIEERIEITKILEGGIERILYKKGENKPFTGKIVKDFENDGVSFEINVKNGKKDGVSIAYYYPKEIQMKESYKNGKLYGNRTTYYRGGQIQSESIYENGIPINEAKYYYEDGQPQVFIDYKNKIKKTYYRDGALYVEVRFLDNDEWKYEGEAKLYYQTGEILGIEQFKKGVLNGKSVYYYENGKVKVIEIYEHGMFISKKEF